MYKFWTILIFIIISISANAMEGVLCSVTSDVDSEVLKFVYDINEITNEINHLYKDRELNGNKISREEMNIDQLNNDGIILSQKSGQIVVRMYGRNFDVKQGGILVLDYLYSGIGGERRELEMNVNWAQAFNEMMLFKPLLFIGQKQVSNLQFIANRSKVWGIIGIHHINY